MADITIYGAGIFGLSVGWACLQRGARVQVIDPAGVASGASGGVVGALAPHTPEAWNPKKAFQLDSLLMAEGFWTRVDARSGLSSGYARLGRLQPVADARALDLARRREGTAAELWAEHATWRVQEMPPGAWTPQSATGYVIHDTLSARLHPRRACESLAQAIRNAGGVVLRSGDAQGAVIWANGVAGLKMLEQELGAPIGNGVKGQAALLRHDVRHQPQIFADGLHIVPHADGTVAIGSTSERDFDQPATTDDRLDALITKARLSCPALAEAPVVARWAGVRPRTTTRAPVLGAWPGKDGHFIANGGFKIGFGIAPKIAECMADLVLENRSNIPPEFSTEALIPPRRPDHRL